MRVSSVKVEASGIVSDGVAAVIRRAHAADFQGSVIELLASYFSPTFQLLSGPTVARTQC